MHNKLWAKNCIVKFAKLFLYNIFPFCSCVFNFFWIKLIFLYFLVDNWNLCLLKLCLYFDNACKVALSVLIIGEKRWIWFWILWQWMLQLIRQSCCFVTRKISLVSKMHYLSLQQIFSWRHIKLFWHHYFLHVVIDPLTYLKGLHYFVKFSLSSSLFIWHIRTWL